MLPLKKAECMTAFEPMPNSAKLLEPTGPSKHGQYSDATITP
jgi:hypothetical protein